MEIIFDNDGTAQLVLHYRCRECGAVVAVPTHLEEHFKENNPACPKCHAENCWELIEEEEE